MHILDNGRISRNRWCRRGCERVKSKTRNADLVSKDGRGFARCPRTHSILNRARIIRRMRDVII